MASPATRSPERTRERIVAAALAEFATRGFSGARVDAIARRARINKRMLYHYFGNKEQLYSEILRRKMAEKVKLRDADPDDPSDALVYWYESVCADPHWVRLMEWEALGVGEGELISERERRQGIAGAIARVRRRQETGALSADLESEPLFMLVIALSVFPSAFPQLARLATGHGPSSPAFRRRWTRFLRSVAEHLRPRLSGRKGSAA